MLTAKQQITEFAKQNNLTLLPLEEIKKGDFYVACRNTGPKLLEFKVTGEKKMIGTYNAEKYSYKDHCIDSRAR